MPPSPVSARTVTKSTLSHSPSTFDFFKCGLSAKHLCSPNYKNLVKLPIFLFLWSTPSLGLDEKRHPWGKRTFQYSGKSLYVSSSHSNLSPSERLLGLCLDSLSWLWVQSPHLPGQSQTPVTLFFAFSLWHWDYQKLSFPMLFYKEKEG